MAYPTNPIIEKGVPLPPVGKYRVREMKLGDSFFVRGKTEPGMAGFRAYWKRVCKFKFRIQGRVENGKRGVRIWRVK